MCQIPINVLIFAFFKVKGELCELHLPFLLSLPFSLRPPSSRLKTKGKDEGGGAVTEGVTRAIIPNLEVAVDRGAEADNGEAAAVDRGAAEVVADNGVVVVADRAAAGHGVVEVKAVVSAAPVVADRAAANLAKNAWRVFSNSWMPTATVKSMPAKFKPLGPEPVFSI